MKAYVIYEPPGKYVGHDGLVNNIMDACWYSDRHQAEQDAGPTGVVEQIQTQNRKML